MTRSREKILHFPDTASNCLSIKRSNRKLVRDNAACWLQEKPAVATGQQLISKEHIQRSGGCILSPQPD